MGSRSRSYFTRLHVILISTLYGSGRIIPAQDMKASGGGKTKSYKTSLPWHQMQVGEIHGLTAVP
jgi:hypothetical protein